VGDAEATAAGKWEARRRLLALVDDGLGVHTPVALRINAAASDEFRRDLPVASRLAAIGALELLLLPKLEDPDQLIRASRLLAEAGVPAKALVPMLETRQGVAAAQDIVEAARQLGCGAVVYGHYDYCLEAQLWPFPASDEPAFWGPATAVIAASRRAGLSYVHPIPAELADSAVTAAVIAALRQRCGDHWQILSAGPAQTLLLRRLIQQVQVPLPLPSALPLRPSAPLSQHAQRELALRVIASHAGRGHSQLACARERASQAFVPPHLVAAAHRCLEQHRSAEAG